jgi:hypothetical protein
MLEKPIVVEHMLKDFRNTCYEVLGELKAPKLHDTWDWIKMSKALLDGKSVWQYKAKEANYGKYASQMHA